MYVGLHVKYPLFLSHFNEIWIFSIDFSKNAQLFMKISSVGDELFHTDGQTDSQTDMTNIIVAFRNFANTPNWYTFCSQNVFLSLEWISVQTTIILLYSNNWVVFVTETGSVYCAVRTESLTVVQMILVLKELMLPLLLHRASCRFTNYHTTNKCTNCMSFIFKSLF